YDTSSYGRNRDTARSTASSTTDRPTTVTAKYTTTPSYKSSSIPILHSERNTAEKETPITAIANKYANYNKTEKPTSKYEKKDYSKLTVPSITTTKSRDPSPVSTSSKYNIGRTSRHLSPERRTTKSYKDNIRDPSPGDRDRDIPSKTDKSTGYNSLSSYKLYPRSSSYTRPASRTESKPEVTVNRYAIANRLSSNYLRTPPAVKRSSVSPVNHIEITKRDTENPMSPIHQVIYENPKIQNESNMTVEENGKSVQSYAENETETITIITRHTSPTPPGSSAYVRTRRADMAKTVEKIVTRMRKRPEMVDKEIQSDRLDDPTRSSRFGSTARASVNSWSILTPSTNSYTGYAGRYSTQYSNTRENSGSNSYNERSSRSRSTEPQLKENSCGTSYSESHSDKINPILESNPKIITAVYEQTKGDDPSEIIINVNLKLKRPKSPAASTELVSPEITITNSQLPPQAPKTDGAVKTKKVKVRKTSTDSSSDTGSKKKIVKKRSKSVSSTDSDQGHEISNKSSTSSPKSIPKSTSNSNLTNGPSNLKHSKSRESNSPESSITLSTQSSISEDEIISKSKSHEASRTSADEMSLPMDRSGRLPSPLLQKNENEEAKSFLIRALAPVTNLFKMRQTDSSENSHWPDTSTESTGKDVSNLLTESGRSNKSKNVVASNEDNLVQLKGIRPLDSGERAWWLDSEPDKKSSNLSNENSRTPPDKNIPRKIRHIESGERAWWMESNSENKSANQAQPMNTPDSSNSDKPFKKCKFLDDEKPWWLDSCANIPEGIERLTPPRKSSSDSDKSEKFNFFKVRRIESGEQKDWWATSNENSSNSNKLDPQGLNKSGSQLSKSGSQSLSKSGSDRNFPMRRIRHIESGERPWWLASDKNIPEGIEKLPTPPPQDESDSSDSEEVQVYSIPTHIPPFPLHLPDDEPLGARRSPEGLETPKENEDYRGRSSPYENNQFRRRSSTNNQKGVEKYISRYTDIDDILGTSGQIYSPFMDSILARRTGQMSYNDDECEEIDPTQVQEASPQRSGSSELKGALHSVSLNRSPMRELRQREMPVESAQLTFQKRDVTAIES
ncbi:Uncharacterized protein OBRU01_07213, partial [Operophtera brumata]